MGFGDSVGRLRSNMQEGLKSTSLKALIIFLRVVTGLMLGLTIGLISQEILEFGAFALTFVTITIGAAFVKLSSSWTLASILIFDLICILIAMLLRMYILIAPGQ